jgi:DNA-binding response OmpR family regulator
MDGFTFAREIRLSDALTPIIFLTARSMKEDRIEGFRIGADDFVTKPFSMEELLLRIEAVLRRSQRSTDPSAESSPGIFSIGGITFDYPRRQLTVASAEIALTPKEAALLRMLLSRPGEVLDRTTALQEIWGSDNYYNSRSMDVFISRLRKYLKDSPEIEILTVHGQGFRLISKK